MVEYYVPSIEEFVQCFKFEYLCKNDYSFVILDLGNNTVTGNEEYHIEDWIPIEVTWKRNPNEIFKYDDGEVLWSMSGSLLNFFTQWDDIKIIKYLKDGRIRAKR